MRNEHAVVIGGGFAGLLSAHVLTRHFDEVTILERDHVPKEPDARPGTPQGRHIHGLLVRGWRILHQLLPNLYGELLGRGAHVIDVMNDIVRLGPGGWCPRAKSNHLTMACSRDLLEWAVRRQVLANPRVRLIEGFDTSGLLVDAHGETIIGIRARGGEDVKGSWVIDASGRHSHAPEWLEALGYSPPRETRVDSFAGYASRCYEPPRDLKHDWKALLIGSHPPDLPRAGALSPLEENRWIVTLSGAARDYPPTDEHGFLAFAKSLADPILYRLIARARPLSRIHGYRRNEGRLRHWESMKRMPKRFAVVGDAVCALNPIYGQGMTAAALGAELLDRCFAENAHDDARNTHFQKRLARENATLWTMATGEDYRYRETEGKPRTLQTKLAHAYMDRIFSLAARRTDVYSQLLDVGHLLSKPISLLRPDIAFRALLIDPRKRPPAPSGAPLALLEDHAAPS